MKDPTLVESASASDVVSHGSVVRERKLTAKGQQYESEKLTHLIEKKVSKCYLFADELQNKDEFKSTASENLTVELGELNALYERLRETISQTPPPKISRAIDNVNAYVKGIVSNVHNPGKTSSHRSISTRSSHHSSMRRELAAQAAALQAEIRSRDEESIKTDELKRLELDESKRRLRNFYNGLVCMFSGVHPCWLNIRGLYATRTACHTFIHGGIK